jgi:hypothetical protein
MLVVPVHFPSYHWSGNTYSFGVGDEVRDELALADEPWLVPDEMLADIDASTEPADEPWPEGDWYPTFIRQNGLVAFWSADRAPEERLRTKAWFRVDDSRRPDDVPQTVGRVVSIHAAFLLYRQGEDGLSRPVENVLALAEVRHTDDEFPPTFNVHSRGPTPELETGRWEHTGWFVRVEVLDAASSET